MLNLLLSIEPDEGIRILIGLVFVVISLLVLISFFSACSNIKKIYLLLWEEKYQRDKEREAKRKKETAQS